MSEELNGGMAAKELFNFMNDYQATDVAEKLQWFEDWGLTPKTASEVLRNYSAFLSYMTGGKLSKIGYDLQTMKTIADDYWNLELEMEKEPVKPIKTPETIRDEYNCGNCTTKVGVLFHNSDEWYYHVNYCPRCGKKVKWND